MLAQPLMSLLFLHVFLFIIFNSLFPSLALSIDIPKASKFSNPSNDASSKEDSQSGKCLEGQPPVPDTWNLFGIPGDGYYIAAQIGTPPQQMNLVVDTGSSNLAVAGANSSELDSFFKPHASSSFVFINDSHLKVSYSQGWWAGSLGTDLVEVPGLRCSFKTRSFVALITQSQGFYVNGSHWQGILGLAFPELAQPNRTVTPWFDSVLSSTKSLNSATSILLSPEKNSSLTRQSTSSNDGLDLEEFIRQVKIDKYKKSLKYSDNEDIIDKLFDNESAVQSSAVSVRPHHDALREKRAKIHSSSAMMPSHTVQLDNRRRSSSVEFRNSRRESNETVIQRVGMLLEDMLSSINDVPRNLSVIMDVPAESGPEPLVEYSTAKNSGLYLIPETMVDLLSTDNLSETLNVSNVELYTTNQSNLFENVRSAMENDSLQMTHLDAIKTNRDLPVSQVQKRDIGNYSVLENWINLEQNINEDTSLKLSSDSSRNLRNTVLNSSVKVENFVEKKSAESMDSHAPDIHSSSSISKPRQKEMPSQEKKEHISENINLSESFTLELCGPWSSTLHDTHKGRLTVGDGSHCSAGVVHKTPILAPWYYEVAVTSMSVAGALLSLPCLAYNHHASIVDSGTTKLKLPQVAFDAVVSALEAATAGLVDAGLPENFWRGDGHVCWTDAHIAWSLLPTLSIGIASSNSSSFSIELGPRSYLRPYDVTTPAGGAASAGDAYAGGASGTVPDTVASDATTPNKFTSSAMPAEAPTLAIPSSRVATSKLYEIHKLAANAAINLDVDELSKSKKSSTLEILTEDLKKSMDTDGHESLTSTETHGDSPNDNEEHLRGRVETSMAAGADGIDSHRLVPFQDYLANDVLRENNHIARAEITGVNYSSDDVLVQNHSIQLPDTNLDSLPSSTFGSLNETQKEKSQDNLTRILPSEFPPAKIDALAAGVAEPASNVPCWSSGLELSNMGTVLGVVVLEGLCVRFDRGAGVVSFSEGSCGPRVAISGPYPRLEAEVCASPHRGAPDTGSAGTVVLAALLAVLCCPLAVYGLRAAWRMSRHRFQLFHQAETTFMSLDESTSLA
ncbi:uncharacterized protein LOC108683019 [Hyalella azteca]|uniref:Uncharacterized protein LOC108683019 n=1 Tax=Hyalella azteca TaxID=294128 RepID=A0A8B7PQN1_HYAAZ|nr:uncharacterized protein LOC108683019 [Hyalella azteca]